MSKNIIKILTVGLLAFLWGSAEADSVKAHLQGDGTGKVWTMPVTLRNTGSYIAFQMDIDLPDEVTLTSVTPNTARLATGDDVTIEGEKVATPFEIRYNIIDEETNTVRILGYNLGNNEIKGNSGEVFMTLNMTTVVAMTEDDMTATLSNIAFAKNDGLTSVTLRGNAGSDEVVGYFHDSDGGKEWTMPLSLENTGNYVAFQMEIDLPDGVTLTSVTSNTDRLAQGEDITIEGEKVATPFEVKYNVSDEDKNIVSILGYNLGNNNIAGNSGDVIITLGMKSLVKMTKEDMSASFSKVQFVKDDGLTLKSLFWEVISEDEAMGEASPPYVDETLRYEDETLRYENRKYLENGQIVIIKNGRKYNAVGVRRP